MKGLKKSSNKKLTIVNFEKLKGCTYPAVATPSSFVFQLKVTDVSDDEDHYMLYVEYGVDTLSKTHIRINRDISASPKGFYGYKVEVSMPVFNTNTHFVMSSFETPAKLLKELSTYIKTEIETLPF
jgi:hypothetical protein